MILCANFRIALTFISVYAKLKKAEQIRCARTSAQDLKDDGSEQRGCAEKAARPS